MTRNELLQTAQQVEALGYDVFSCSDHLNFPGSEMAPLITLSAVAAVTQQLQLQPMVLANDFRHPAVVASETATLDRISDGRCALGIGAGWLGPDFQGPGLPFDSAGERVERLAESVQVIRGLHSDRPFSFQGKHYVIGNMSGNMRGAPELVRSPMPLMIGGSGQRILSLAARTADTVSINMGLPLSAGRWQQGDSPYADVTDQKLQWIRAAAGERFSQLELQVAVMAGGITAGDPLASLAPVASMLGVSPSQLWGSPQIGRAHV